MKQLSEVIQLLIRMKNLKSSFLGGSDGKESSCNVGDVGSIPQSGRSPGEENGNPLQHSCLGNLMDRGDGQATVHGAAETWQNRVTNTLSSIPTSFISSLYFC